MGGRGSASGISVRGKKYGTEYRTVYQSGNIKFVKANEGAATAPMETMTQKRIYVTVNEQDKLKAISFYDKENKRYKQIDLSGTPHTVNGEKLLPHTHFGYIHDEHGTKAITEREWKIIDKVYKLWYKNTSKQ